MNGIEWSQRKYWTVDLLQEVLVFYTVLGIEELGNFELLWQAKLDCEKVRGSVIRPA